MTDLATLDTYGTLTEPATLKIERILPGPVERVWAYLTESEMRRRWLAAGDMELKAGASFELVWHNDELTDPPGERPPGFGTEHRMTCRILEVDPPRRLAFTFGNSGEVSFVLAPRGNGVLLTLVHRRLPERTTMLMVSAGWHAHLDVLVARASGKEPDPFWDRWSRLKGEYEGRIPA
jgi:uncharacterized protein YndB with AHSA1/START domain